MAWYYYLGIAAWSFFYIKNTIILDIVRYI